MTNFLLKEKLQWTPLSSTNSTTGLVFAVKDHKPFADREDYKILRNDWPYGLALGITHIVVWLKTRLPVDSETGDLTADGSRLVQEFVQTAFEKGLGCEGQDKVMWFKNWTGLQSVRELEHIHLLVRDIEEEKLDQIIDSPFA